MQKLKLCTGSVPRCCVAGSLNHGSTILHALKKKETIMRLNTFSTLPSQELNRISYIYSSFHLRSPVNITTHGSLRVPV